MQLGSRQIKGAAGIYEVLALALILQYCMQMRSAVAKFKREQFAHGRERMTALISLIAQSSAS